VLHDREAVGADGDANVIGGLVDLLPSARAGRRRSEETGRPHGQSKRK
jgi:hypothetical protein